MSQPSTQINSIFWYLVTTVWCPHFFFHNFDIANFENSLQYLNLNVNRLFWRCVAKLLDVYQPSTFLKQIHMPMNLIAENHTYTTYYWKKYWWTRWLKCNSFFARANKSALKYTFLRYPVQSSAVVCGW